MEVIRYLYQTANPRQGGRLIREKTYLRPPKRNQAALHR